MNGTRNGTNWMPVLALSALAIFIALLVIERFNNPFAPIDLGDVKPAEVGQTLLGFLLIALFVERTVEVYTNVWRKPGRQERLAKAQASTANVAVTERQLNAALSADRAPVEDIERLGTERTEAVREAAQKSAALESYRSETRSQTSLAALLLGLVIALCGFQALAAFSPSPCERGAVTIGGQCTFFTITDIVITAALIGGGADGIHKIISIFTTYSEATKAQLEKTGPAASVGSGGASG